MAIYSTDEAFMSRRRFLKSSALIGAATVAGRLGATVEGAFLQAPPNAVGKVMRLHQHEPREPHRAYRPRRRADIARMRGAHEDESQGGARD